MGYRQDKEKRGGENNANRNDIFTLDLYLHPSKHADVIRTMRPQDNLENKLRFIEESNQYKDYKPFFTDMWDAINFTQDLSFNPK